MGRWVSTVDLREEPEKVCLLGFYFPRKFIGLWICWRLVSLLSL